MVCNIVGQMTGLFSESQYVALDKLSETQKVFFFDHFGIVFFPTSISFLCSSHSLLILAEAASFSKQTITYHNSTWEAVDFHGSIGMYLDATGVHMQNCNLVIEMDRIFKWIGFVLLRRLVSSGFLCHYFQEPKVALVLLTDFSTVLGIDAFQSGRGLGYYWCKLQKLTNPNGSSRVFFLSAGMKLVFVELDRATSDLEGSAMYKIVKDADEISILILFPVVRREKPSSHQLSHLFG
ncbi:hypothetical protein RHSIM_Rhsim04G0152700 [Rhododendron simsii]|uniref:Uncharacterized protein n=1 Tax=Rhododendron simsii TaxID=118357 RepID=A0A834H4G6_RHOSS|nr:hypothetical protein RHSIM_Rhsim04G0152700 [Rhododendron simsii]